MVQQSASSQNRQPTSYPSPHSYPSPSMSAYAYPPPTQQPQQSVETYRASPTGSHVSLQSLNLPPIRSIDPRNAQPGPGSIGSPLPPPVGSMGSVGYPYSQSLPPPQHPMNVTSSPHHHHQPHQYPIPQPHGRVMSGGRHKKEIKRRTKTGCLTCRKRRIKCDEAHPTCRNCQKSKRDCLGYDPIFKAQPGPAAIQPAPHSASPTGQNSSGPYAPLLQNYGQSVSGSFAPALSATASSPASSVEPYDYSAAIDPALEAAAPNSMAMPPNAYDGTAGFRPDLKRGLGESASPYSSAASDTQNLRGGATPTPSCMITPEPSSDGVGASRTCSAHTSLPAKRIKIDDLLSIGGAVPPPTPPTDLGVLEDMKRIFSTIYAPAIDAFLETRWYTARGLPWLLEDAPLCASFAALLERFKVRHGADDGDALTTTRTMEMRVIWSLMCLCRTAATAAHPDTAPAAHGDARNGQLMLEEARRRLLVFEDLISGTVVDVNHAEPASSIAVRDPQKLRELDFWKLVGQFLTLRDDEASSAKEMDDTLALCRNLLDARENRDVIYSIAIVRHVGQRVAEFPNHVPEAVSNDEDDARNKLWVAKSFIEGESDGRGTNAVIQRLCGMATRSWSATSSLGT
ncbi:MAG: hypothetical protein M1817_001649 [Caeruleum heppii]|nr:MAG: hypothetical protein M1817_001649 [Caeruleum heppii]